MVFLELRRDSRVTTGNSVDVEGNDIKLDVCLFVLSWINVMDREAWCAAVKRVAKSLTGLSDGTELN